MLRKPVPARRGEQPSQPPVKVWPQIVEILCAAADPLTPKQIREQLEARLGHPVAASTVKSCLLRNVGPTGSLERRGAGSYVLVGSAEKEHARSQRPLRARQLWPEIARILDAATGPLSADEVRQRLEQQRGKPVSLFYVNDCLGRQARPGGGTVRDGAGRFAASHRGHQIERSVHHRND
ncbi:MAG: DEK C-terminal domain-containing protein [Patulibacter minatonensis]